MDFVWFALNGGPQFTFNPLLPSILALTGFTILLLSLVFYFWPQVKTLTRHEWTYFVVIAAAAIPAALAFVLNVEFAAGFMSQQTFALLALLPPLTAALFLGPMPGLGVGLVTGLSWMLFSTGRITQPFEVALYGVITATMLHQNYRGTINKIMRQPVVASLFAALVILLPASLFGFFSTNFSDSLVSLDQTFVEALPHVIIFGSQALIAGILLQAILAARPDFHPVHENHLHIAPWQKRLRLRVLLTMFPLILAAIVMLVGLVTVTSYTVATRLVIGQMARDAENAGSGFPFFIQAGQGLIRDLAGDADLQEGETQELQTQLTSSLRSVPFFEQLIYIQPGEEESRFPQDSSQLGTEELGRVNFAIEEGIPGETLIRNRDPGEAAVISFVAPVIDPETDEPVGALVGRTSLDTNPILVPATTLLNQSANPIVLSTRGENTIGASGEGFVIDSENTILLYPAQPERQQEELEITNTTRIGSFGGNGQALRQQLPDGSQRLLYIQPITGRSDWSIVIVVPNTVAVALAVQIALPTLLLLVTLALAALGLTVLGVQRVTGPLEDLLNAVNKISEGALDEPIEVSGEDEIGQLGHGFEEMRLRLKNRLDELERLLSVSRTVSSSLELFRAMPPILGAATGMTGALCARIVLRYEDGGTQSYISGENNSEIAELDNTLLNLVEQQGTIVISKLARAAGALKNKDIPEGIGALLAIPLRSERSYHGVLWLGYRDEHHFEQSEMTFVSTLAGQAAVAVANASLFDETEQGRRQLEAILESTADGMIVTDDSGRVVLMNPAAETYLGVVSDDVVGMNAQNVIDEPELTHLMTDLQEPAASLELPGRHGRVIFANTSTIVSDGVIAGRVAVLRDITPLKELDNIKTVFLRIVSHDLRSPLTFMRGYVSMLPMMGPMNEKQLESLDKIDAGIDNITEMTERLTHLSRLTFGDDAELEFALVDVEELLHDMLIQTSPLAAEKNITVEVDAQEALPLVLADYLLYRQAVQNLVTNAIKYTSDDGLVRIEVHVTDNNHLRIAIIDNGVGIRKEDQQRLTEAFYRVPQREGDETRPRGYGLGLALVKAIMQAHDGELQIQSEYGKGSTFTLLMPVRTTVSST